MKSDFDAVGDFHEKFGLDNVTHRSPGPREVPRSLIDFRLRFLIEELKETAKGLGVDLEVTTTRRESVDHLNISEIADGLVDLSYVTLGTAHVFGLPWDQLFDEVQRANITKERATRPEQSVRGGKWDVIKPPGWRGPDITGVLRKFGWK
jgi:predicted HAD superfamily Cof-like phosphohydrolase